jgi:peptidoglycan/xylan/chitin deacetylase (PgdA/CDA1 family)
MKRIAAFLAAFGVIAGLMATTGRLIQTGRPQSSTQFARVPASPAPPPAPAPFREISPRAAGNQAIIVMYHDVVDRRGPGSVWFDITVDELRADLDAIERAGGRVVRLEDLHAALVEGAPLPDRAVVLTFDDNYEGFYRHARSLLVERRAPATVFIHTGHIGSRSGRPKMTEAMLREIDQDGLFTFGSHTVTHPEDITRLSESEQIAELRDSKARLERLFKREIPWLSWPVGNQDADARALAQRMGYRMATTMRFGRAAASASILAVNRIPHNRLRDALAMWPQDAVTAGWREMAWQKAPIERQDLREGRTKLIALVGGSARTVLIPGRWQVGDIVCEYEADAGINAGYFAMSAIASEDDQMVGPCLASNRARLIRDEDAERANKVAGRPLVMWNDERVAVAPYVPGLHDDAARLEEAFPGARNVFLAGAWLVLDGSPLTAEQIARLGCPKDAVDRRKRAFFGVTRDGRPIVGATENGASSERLAAAAAAAGAQIAVLLDSGFSTSLVLGREVLAFGHRSRTHGSRPVPHAILLDQPEATP